MPSRWFRKWSDVKNRRNDLECLLQKSAFRMQEPRWTAGKRCRLQSLEPVRIGDLRLDDMVQTLA